MFFQILDMWFKSLLKKKCSQVRLKFLCKSNYSNKSTELQFVGHFTQPLSSRSVYPVGQLFLHKVFGYRGIILHPWIASVYEKRRQRHGKIQSKGKLAGTSLNVQTYYQVLMDMRDYPCHQSENAFTFTSLNVSDPVNLIDYIPGIDYVDHNNILPYKSDIKNPIQHQLFEYFFDFKKDKKFGVSRLFKVWQQENSNFLEVDKVYTSVYNNLKIVITPFYLGFINELIGKDEHWWRYTICVENMGDDEVIIEQRHWKIISNGSVKKSKNLGEDKNPLVLDKKQPIYINSSHISLEASSGTVRGLLKIRLKNGKKIDVRTPTFFLESRCAFQP